MIDAPEKRVIAGRRRRKGGPLLVALLVSLALLPVKGSIATGPNPIVVENQQPGTSDWQMGRPGFQLSNDVTGQIKGYASATSVNKGGAIAFHVSVNPAQHFTADIFRMGWYGGLRGRFMTRLGPIPGTKQRTCTPNTTTGIIDCAWSPSYTLTVPTTWTSGVYLAQLTNAQNYQSYMTFVVRDDARTADLLFQQSVTTYQAYNNYPADGATGKSLYDFNSHGATVPASGGRRAAKVSFNRPYAATAGHGSGFDGNSWNWERYYIGWLEQNGYDVAYATNLDTHTSGAHLMEFKAFLSVGHDEYWSKAMVDNVTAARDAGVNLGFFGSNTAYWQVRFEPSASGVANRVMVCYKDAARDPIKNQTATVLWRDPPVNRPEQALVGIQYTSHLQGEGQGAMYVVQNSSHWVWSGTGFTDGTKVPGILGYETDRLMSEYPSPAGTDYAILSGSPVVDNAGRSDTANTSVYRAPSGAWVFGSGTNHWSYGLGMPGVTDARIQRATANILTRFLSTTPNTPPTAAASTTRSVTVTAPPVTTYVSDQFSRTMTNGWGTATTGGAWTVTSVAANYGVNGSAGTIANPAGAGRLAYLGGVSAPAADAVVSFGLNKLATGGAMYLMTHPRRIGGQGSYAAKALVTSAGSVTLGLIRTDSAGAETTIQAATSIAGVTYAVGDRLTVRAQAVQTSPTSTTVRAKVWKTGTAEPAAWQRSVADTTAGLQAAGHVGFGSYVASAATNGPITVAVDQLVVTAP